MYQFKIHSYFYLKYFILFLLTFFILPNDLMIYLKNTLNFYFFNFVDIYVYYHYLLKIKLLIHLILIIIFILFIYSLLKKYLTFINIIENKIIIKSFLFHFKYLEIKKSTIESIDIKQSIIGLILNFGTIIIYQKNGQIIILKNIAKPFHLKKFIF